jgi:tRNA A-37 threonylcarbamoyl transferase component Bud32
LCDPSVAAALAPWLEAEDPLAWPGLTEVKTSTVRTVLRGELGGVAVHLKRYRAVRLSDRARDALGGSRGVKEFRNLERARARGLPCVEPLAAGRLAGSFGTRSFLCTRSVAGAAALPRGPLPAGTAAAAGALLRRAHDAGLSAPDLHPGNVLSAPDGALHLLDLHSATLTEPLDQAERARALAFFCLDLDGGVADPAARPLLDAYGASPALREAAARAGRVQRNHALGAFGRRATRACLQTQVERDADGALRHLHRPAADLHAAARAFFAGDRPAPTKDGRRGTVWLGERLAVKQRPAAAARRLFQAAYWLLFAKVPTAEPVALQVRHGVGLCAMRRIDAPDLAAELDRDLLDGAALRAAARSLGRSLGRLHGLGLRNRDLKFENLIREPGSGEVLWIDLDGVRRRTPLEPRGRAADLGRLLAAWADRDDPRHGRVVWSFWRAYHRALRCLHSSSPNDLRRRSEARAREWRRKHRTSPSPSGAG